MRPGCRKAPRGRVAPKHRPEKKRMFSMDLVIALISIIAVNLVAWATPGPNMIAVISVSIEGGRGSGIMTGTGLACSSLIWSMLAVFGGASILEAFPQLFSAVRLAGALYLGWLGVRSLQGAMSGSAPAVANVWKKARSGISAMRAFRHGLLIGLTNPKAIFFFGAIMTSFVPPAAQGWFLVIVVLVCGGIGIALHSLTATLFSSRAAVRMLTHRQGLIAAVTGIIFCCFAAMAAWPTIEGRF